MLPSSKKGGYADVSLDLHHIANWCYKQNAVPLTSFPTSHASLVCLILYCLLVTIIRCCFFEFCLPIRFALFWKQPPPFSHFCINQESAVEADTQYVFSNINVYGLCPHALVYNWVRLLEWASLWPKFIFILWLNVLIQCSYTRRNHSLNDTIKGAMYTSLP